MLTPALDKYSNFTQPLSWSQLLGEINRGRLIPVIGAELLEVDYKGETGLLYEHIAKQLVEDLGLPVFDQYTPKSISDVMAVCSRTYSNPDSIYYEVAELLRKHEWPIPPALEKLAEIEPLDLFISTTPDLLMAKAIDKVRFDNDTKTRIYNFSPDIDYEDLPDSFELGKKTEPTVYNLFGDSTDGPEYAASEEDLLRFVHHLQVRDERPQNLFDLLDCSPIALLGCNFPDWLVRFIYCSARGEKVFSHAKSPLGFIADKNTKHEPELLNFLARQRINLYGGNAVEFVNELHKRYKEQQGDNRNKITKKKNDSELDAEAKQPPPQETVFISYASEDFEIAKHFSDFLTQNGIGVWFDQKRLDGGDAFEEVIRDNIQKSDAFIPLISKHTLSKENRFFQKEWRWGIEYATWRPVNYPFIQPIAIDEIAPNSPLIPKEFRERHWRSYPDGQPDQNLVTSIKRSLRRQS